MVTYKCGGYASYTGHCGASDCETCYPGCSKREHTLYTKTFTIEVLSRENLKDISVQEIAALEYEENAYVHIKNTCSCLLYTSPSPRDLSTSRMPSSA